MEHERIDPDPQTQVHILASPEPGPTRTEHELVRRDVQWLKYGVAVSAGTGVFSSALQLGAAPMPAGVAGLVVSLIGLFR